VRVRMRLTWLNSKLGCWFELAGKCYVYALTGDLPDDDSRDLWNSRALDPGEVWIVNGINKLELFVAMRSTGRDSG
jgi:hypothetical protein